MLNFEITYPETIRVKVFDCINDLPIMIRKPLEGEFDGLPCESYVMEVEGYSQLFQYNIESDKFFVDHKDKEKEAALNKEHAEYMETLTELEKAERIKGKAVNFYNRTEYVLIAKGKQLNETVKQYIKEFNL